MTYNGPRSIPSSSATIVPSSAISTQDSPQKQARGPCPTEARLWTARWSRAPSRSILRNYGVSVTDPASRAIW